MMLCCLHDGFNGTVGLSLSQVFLESISEDGQLAIGLEATEGFLGLQQAGGGPSERHLGVSPAFDVAGAHNLDRGGMRRTWLRGRENVHKRYLLHVAGHNLSLLMRQLIGAGTPKEAVAGGIGALFVLVTPAGAVLVVQIVLIVSEDGETAFAAICFAVA